LPLLLCDNDWLFDLEFIVDVTDHFNHLNIKLQGKSKLFLHLINHINTLKLKLKLSISQLENEYMSQFLYLKEHIEGAVDNSI